MLIDYLSSQKISQIDVITDSARLDSKTILLLNGIRNGQITSDKEGMMLIYGNVNQKEAYRKLKYRLKQRALNTVFLSDIQNLSRNTWEKSQLNLIKAWASADMLKYRGLSTKFNIAANESLLKNALKLERHDISISILGRLTQYYGIIDYKKSKFLKYRKLLEEQMLEYQLLIKVKELYILIGQLVAIKKSTPYNEEVKALEQSLYDLEEQIINSDNRRINFNGYNCFYFIGMIKKDLAMMKKYCLLGLDFFQKIAMSPMNRGLGLYSFTQKMGLVSLAEQNYEQAISYFDKCFEYRKLPGSVGWQYHYNYKFLTLLLLQKYDEAYLTIATLMNHKLFKKLADTYRQPWYIKEAYIQFLIKIGKISPETLEKAKLRTFRINRFINEVPNLASDKQGQNVTINIVQLLYLVLKQDHDAVMFKINSLNQYSFRNLKGPQSIRQRTFIKMLSKLEDGSYSTKRILRKAKNHIKTLSNNPLDYSEQALQIEIIPYEQLWDQLMDTLEQTYTTN